MTDKIPDALAPPCGYQGYEFGAGSYPDSVCIDGRLYDADNCDDNGNIFDMDEDVPCPMCRPLEAIAWWTERNECFCDEDETDEQAHIRALESAQSLVLDIRKNHRVETDLKVLAAEDLK